MSRPEHCSREEALGVAWLAARTGRDLQRAMRMTGGAGPLWRSGAGTLGRVLGLAPSEASDLRAAIRTARHTDLERGVADVGQRFVAVGEEEFPAGLSALFDPPVGIFAAGALRGIRAELGGAPCVGVVGARRATAAGMDFARWLARDLAAAGAVVVSGMARGIDGAAHLGALDADGLTVAVVGCGADVVYPARNRALRGRIMERGVVISEYWPGTRPAPWRFPARNRLVAALSDVVVVIEAGERSGALITCDFALEIGRPVLAVPGPPGAPSVAGCHALLRAGAGICERPEDVVAELPGAAWRSRPACAAHGELGSAVLAVLDEGPLPADVIVARLGRDPALVTGELTRLELVGDVASGGGRYRRTGRR